MFYKTLPRMVFDFAMRHAHFRRHAIVTAALVIAVILDFVGIPHVAPWVALSGNLVWLWET